MRRRVRALAHTCEKVSGGRRRAVDGFAERGGGALLAYLRQRRGERRGDHSWQDATGPSDRVKTDRKEAEMRVWPLSAGSLTGLWSRPSRARQHGGRQSPENGAVSSRRSLRLQVTARCREPPADEYLLGGPLSRLFRRRQRAAEPGQDRPATRAACWSAPVRSLEHRHGFREERHNASTTVAFWNREGTPACHGLRAPLIPGPT